jgi:hypothetical protein
MNSDFLRKENESFLDYCDRLITSRIEYDLDKTEVYELLYGEQVSADHARKCLTNLERTIEESKKTTIEKQIHSDFNDKDLENTLNKNYKNVVELNKDGSQTSDKLLTMSEEECKDVNYLLKAHGYDTVSWELVSARNNIWNVYSKLDGVQTLYSSKIVVKPRTSYEWNEADAIKIFKNLKSDYKNKMVVAEQYSKNDKALVVPIADFHFGLFSDMLSNGNDYNLEIAEKLFYEVINDIKNRNSNKSFEKVIFVVGNDFINADNLSNTTTKGTPQDNTSSWFTIVERATQLIVNGIDILNTIAPVDVQYVTSNHDLHTMFGIMQTIKAHYRNDDDITIDTSPLPRKYYRFGKTLLALSHDVKVKEALKIVTTEAKQEWSNCDHVIFMLAHLHQSMVYEKQGYLEILRLPTISGWSRWTNQMGYVQTEKKNQSFIISGKSGITDTMNTILE